MADQEKMDITNGWESVSDDLARWVSLTERYRCDNPTPHSVYTFDDFTFEHNPKNLSNPYDAYHFTALNMTGEVVGTLAFDDYEGTNQFMKGVVQVHPHFRRKGIATRMYDLAEKVMGLSFKPDTPNSPLANAFWADRQKRIYEASLVNPKDALTKPASHKKSASPAP